MFFQVSNSRVLGLIACTVLSAYCLRLDAANSSTSEVAIKYKTEGLAGFQLADYQDELLQCSALSAIHMWIGDNIGADEGAEVRKAISEDYWLDISRGYLALATKASGKDDLSDEVGTQIKNMAAEWRRLTEAAVSADEWSSWYELVDRCDSWRPEKTARSFYKNGRKDFAEQEPVPKVAMGTP